MALITLTISAIISIMAGILILIWPKFLNYFIAFWLLITGIIGLLNVYNIV